MSKPNLCRPLLGILAASAISMTAIAEPETYYGPVDFGESVTPAHIQVDMYNLPSRPEWKPGDPIKEIPQRKGVPRDYVAPPTDPQPAGDNYLRELQNSMPKLSGGPAFDTPLINQDGNGFSGVNPPDTVGDVGLNHFVQMINGSGGTQVLVLDKTDGTEVANFSLEDLASGSGTGCTSGSGDPILMFDQSVDNGAGEPNGRWVLTEFTSNSFCAYISQTADIMDGSWFVYEFASDSGGLPDYPKWAVWPDAYYVGANESNRLYAFDRENMLNGATTRPYQVFQVPGLSGFGFQMLQPADWDGQISPPAGNPAYFLRHRDDEVHNSGSSDPSQDFVELWEFELDWDTPGNSNVTGPTNIGVADFESELCGLTAFACVPQPTSTTTLDPLREPVMWRAQYRNFGSHETMVGSFVTDVVGGSADIHGVQWFELRRSGGSWSLHQEGVVSPDSVNRWMSSIAMDGTGNIAMGYNVSDDSSVFPGLRYIGRLVSDPLDTMPRGEFTLVDGSDSNASNRYGDYSAIVVDPIDECTFWFTGEYNIASQWSTRIGAMRFVACGDPGFALTSNDAIGGVCTDSGSADFIADIDVLSINEYTDPVTLSFDPALPAGFTGGFSPNPVTPGNISTSTVTVAGSVTPDTYNLTVLGQGAGASDQTMGLEVTVADAVPGTPTLTSPADAAMNVGFQPTLEWTASSQAASYDLEVATDAGFTSIVYTATVTGTTHQVDTPLDSSTEYFWRVTPGNICGDGTTATAFSFTTQPEPGDCPIGTAAFEVFADDMENGTNGWTLGSGSTQNTWQQTTDNSVSGTTAWNAENLETISDQRLVSPAIQLPDNSVVPLTLRFWNRQELEDASGACWDAGILEISTNGGSSWSQLQSQVLFRDFDGVVNDFSGGPNPLAGSEAWCGDPRDWEDYMVDLSGFADEEIQLRFRVGTDGTIGGREGWTLDDVRVEGCEVVEELIFADGFEDPVPK